ncbi:asparaginase domain-containing protein [Salinisphaera aquimarina]|uniref:Asparaginase domain-containing protein n=1 Tax=Salinisphaera aquimarina TaxID=2094031 RepID=A0ABV7EMX7_9GAMM
MTGTSEPAAISPFTIRVLATGGTIEKTYDAARGALTLDVPVLDHLLAELRQPDVDLRLERVMAMDSLDMDADDRGRIVAAVATTMAAADCHAVLITHGTDTLADTAAALIEGLEQLSIPVVLTGAMVPYRVADSDALQNMAQALMACRLLAPGVYTAFHSRVIPGDRIVKDYEHLTMIEAQPRSG